MPRNIQIEVQIVAQDLSDFLSEPLLSFQMEDNDIGWFPSTSIHDHLLVGACVLSDETSGTGVVPGFFFARIQDMQSVSASREHQIKNNPLFSWQREATCV